MKAVAICFAALLMISPAAAQRTAVVRGIGTQTCKSFIEANAADKQFALLVAQWILGNLTGYFRQAGDDPSRTLSDDLLVKTIIDVCAKNSDKTVDDAVTIVIGALPVSEAKKPPDNK